MRKLILLILVALTALAACQAEEPEPEEVVGVTITLNDVHYDLETIEVEAGNVLVLTLINEGALVHDLVIDELPMAGPPHVHTMEEAGSEHEHNDSATGESEGPDLHVAAAPGTISTATLTPTAPGRYSFYCSVSGHREAGMEGVLVVTEGDG